MSTWKNCVFCVMYKHLSASEFRILTQERLVQNHAYDPFYDHTQEIMGETLKPGENIIKAARRGMQEECGLSLEAQVHFQGVGAAHFFKSDRGEQASCTQPFCYLHSTGEPQLWVGPAFLVQVPVDFEPTNKQSEGEAGAYKWWKPDALLAKIAADPNEFMGLHRPAIKLAAQILKA